MARTTFASIMDQRTDNERRQDATPGREAKPAVGATRKTQPVLERLRQRRRMLLVVTALLVVALVGLVVWWVSAGHYETTDDAFIDARTVQISAQVSAAIVEVPVTDNQMVEAGAVLVRLDDRDFKAQLDQAKAQVAQAQAGIANLDAQIAAQQARIDEANKQVAQSQAALTFAEQQDERYQRLVKTGAVTVEQAQQYAPIICKPRLPLPPHRPTPSLPKSKPRYCRRSANSPTRNCCKGIPRRNRPRSICRARSSPRRSPAA